MTTTIESQLRQMKDGLDLRPDQIDTTQLVPVFIPASFVALGDWPGPYERLRAREVVLTWAVLFPGQTMRSVNSEMQQHWDTQQLDWKAAALRNLSRITGDQPGVRELRRATGEVSAVAFMFEDGLGPSRLLFRRSLAERFPAGYRVAMPEMSCGLAFAGDLQGQDLSTVQDLIDHCYQKGTRPMAPGSYDPEDLLGLDDE
ncbi:MAG TPA: hypothetical protein VKB88_27975 [Bryobacteraceae bacterium]|nr:hypothetical protein [Bryobacteraceae bacterium]